MAQHLGEIVVPERAINITVDGDEDLSVVPVDPQLQKQLLATNGSRHLDSARIGDNRHADGRARTTERDT